MQSRVKEPTNRFNQVFRTVSDLLTYTAPLGGGGFESQPNVERARAASVRRTLPRCRHPRRRERRRSTTGCTDARERGNAAHPSAPTARWCTALSVHELGARSTCHACGFAHSNQALNVSRRFDLTRRPSAPRDRAREKPIASSQLVVRARSTSAFTTADVARLARSLSST